MDGARRSVRPGGKGQGRIEPTFGVRRDSAETPALPAPASRAAQGGGSGASSRRHPLLYKAIRFTLLAAIWGTIVLGLAIVYFIVQRARPHHRRARRSAAQRHHPRRGRHRARRAGLAPRPCPPRRAAALPHQGGDRDRGPTLLSSFRHRPARADARVLPQRKRRHRGRGRLDHHPAARQESVPFAQAHHDAEARRGDLRDLARAALHQGRDPRALSQSRLFRRRHLRHRGRGAALFRQIGALGHAAAGGAACRPAQGAVPLRADPQREACHRRGSTRCSRTWSRPASSRRKRRAQRASSRFA